MQKLLLVLAILTGGNLLASCTVYKSSDRDDFNASGKARAAALSSHLAVTHLSLDDESLLQSPCEAFRAMSVEQIESAFGTSRVTFTNQVSRKTSTCLVESAEAVATTDSLESLSVISCSWKPVDGRPIAVRESLNGQTTEDDYRRDGFRVLTTNVVSGHSLRMNCEAYVPAPALIHANEDVTSADTLTFRFADMATELNRVTLNSTSTLPR